MPLAVVAGMHRSGTSLVTRILNLVGASLGPPGDYSAAGPDNPAGYWECRPIRDLNDRMIEHLGGTWDNPPSLDKSRFQDTSVLREWAREAGHLVAGLYEEAGADGWVAFKDPRVTLLLPFWERAVDIALVVRVSRHPSEVVSSLVARNAMDREWASWLVVRYLAELLSVSSPTVDVDYAEVMGDPQEVGHRLANALGITLDEGAFEAIVGSVRPELRHHRTRAIDVHPGPMEELAIAAYEQLRRPTSSITAWAAALSAGALVPGTSERAAGERYAALRKAREVAEGLGREIESQRRLMKKLEDSRDHYRDAAHAMRDVRDHVVQRRDLALAGLEAKKAALARAVEQRDAVIREREALRARSQDLRDQLTAAVRQRDSAIAERDVLRQRLGGGDPLSRAQQTPNTVAQPQLGGRREIEPE